jgi:hypothetical protein
MLEPGPADRQHHPVFIENHTVVAAVFGQMGYILAVDHVGAMDVHELMVRQFP